jgi:hypothetical protein
MFGDDDHSHPILAILTIINTILVLLVLYLLLAHGVVRSGEVPVVGGYVGNLGLGASSAQATQTATALAEGDTGVVPTPDAAAHPLAAASPTPSGFKGGDPVLVRRNAAFRGSPDFKVDAFCRTQDEVTGTVIDQAPGKSTDELGRTKTIYPVSVKQATCVGGGPVFDMKGWVSEDDLKRP